MKTWAFILLSLPLAGGVGCSGYELRNASHPVVFQGINNLSLPLVINRSAIPGVSPIFTEKLMAFLGQFDRLRVWPWVSPGSEATLLGIVSSGPEFHEVVKVEGREFTFGPLGESIGKRPPFYVPKSSHMNLKLRLALVKNSGKVVFDRTFHLGATFDRVIAETSSQDSRGMVNYTANDGTRREVIHQMADSAIRQFQHLVVDAF